MSIWVGTASGGDPSLPGRVTTLEDTEYVYELWESIGSGTTGTVTLASGAVVLLDRYQGAADALVVQLQTGVPGDQPVYTAASALVTTTFDTSGNYVLSGVPSSYPVALVYQIQIKAKYAHLIPISSIISKTDLASAGSFPSNPTVDSIQFNTAAGITVGVGQVAWNDADGTLDIGLKGGNVTLQVGQENVQLVKAEDNGGLVEGKVYRVTGSDGANVTVLKSQGNSSANAGTTLGVMTESTTGGTKGFMTTFGLVRDIDTSGLTEGAKVYVSPTVAGDLTSTRPQTPDHAVSVGYCIRTSATVGSIFVIVDTGKDYNDIHDILINNPLDGQAVVYDSTLGYWKNNFIVAVQNTDPGLTGPGIWIETGLAPGGTGFTFWFEDGL